jgi:hypothetical protein
MENLQLKHVPVTRTGMLIRKPVAAVFEAFIDPDITTRFWFTRGSGRLEVGKQIQWDWEMYGLSLVLAGLKALLEHDVRLNLVADRYPRGIEEH